MYLQKAIFKNIAPFGDLEFTFDKNQVITFSGTNGRGKTTILSYIADTFFEIAKKAGFQDLLENNTKYYRVISPHTMSSGATYSLVYLRFINEERPIDYIEIIGQLEKETYTQILTLNNPITFENFSEKLKTLGSVKFINITQQAAKVLFEKNILTYFPSDRLEIPAWMNEIEYKKYRFNTKTRFNFDLNKNIESRVISPQIVNWILDIVLDYTKSISLSKEKIIITDIYTKGIYNCLNKILQNILVNKIEKCRFGIGDRKQGAGRVNIVSDHNGAIKIISPTIFHLSSGEISLLVLFGELLKQYDAYSKNKIFSPIDITGIAVIDEIDKHLHIKLQKDTLPLLIQLFPNLQFIVSSHSPFFSLGASEHLKERARFLDLTIGGRDIPVIKTEELEGLYNEILMGNENYKKLYNELESEISLTKKLRIITEGHNLKYIDKAIDLLAPEIKDQIHLCAGIEGKSGKDQLITCYNLFLKIPNHMKLLFIWDCDVKTQIDPLQEGEQIFKFCFPKNTENAKVNSGIENLFPEQLFTLDYYSKKESICEKYGTKHSNEKFEKNKFCEDIIKKGTIDNFSLFHSLIDKIKLVLEKEKTK